MENWIITSCLLIVSTVCGFLIDGKAVKIKTRLLHAAVSALLMVILLLVCPSVLTSVKGYIFAMILYSASISDIRTREVDNYLSVMIAITALIGVNFTDIPEMLVGALIVPFPLFIAAIIKPGKMGGADIKIMATSAFLLGLTKGMAAMMIGLFFGIICTLIIRTIRKTNVRDSFPLVAYLSAGSFLAYLINL